MSRRETPGYHGLSSEENANTEWGRMVAKRGEVSRPYCGCTHDSDGFTWKLRDDEDGREVFVIKTLLFPAALKIAGSRYCDNIFLGA